MTTTDSIPRSRSTWRALLDVVATVALIAAAGVVIWTNLHGNAPPAPPGRPPIPVPLEPVSIEGVPVLGSPTARAVMIEFSDFECPFCGRFSKEVLPEIKTKYVETGQLRVAFRHLPLDRIHPRARPAAEAAECAARQGGFWAFHDRLFADPKKLRDDDLIQYAVETGLDLEAFAVCADTAGHRVQQDVELAEKLGLFGTPVFLLGTLQANSLVRVVEIISGARPIGDFSGSLDRLIQTSR